MLRKIISFFKYRYFEKDERGNTQRDYIKLGRQRNIEFTDEDIKSIREAYLKPYKGHETKKENCYWAADWLIHNKHLVMDYHGFMAKALSESFGASMLFLEGKLTERERLTTFYKILESSQESFAIYKHKWLTETQNKMLYNKILTDSWYCYHMLKVFKKELTQEQRNEILCAMINDNNNSSALRDSFEHYAYANEEERMKLVKAIADKEYIIWYLGLQYYCPQQQDWEIIWPTLKKQVGLGMDNYDMQNILNCNPPEYIRDLINGIMVMKKMTS